MRDHTWETADEREFDAMPEKSLPELPPAEVVQQVTPWRRAMKRLLVGLVLNTITLQFWRLQYILPAAGLLLMLLGLRSLRGENRWLQGCFVLVAVKAACFWPLLVLNASIYQGAVSSSPVYTVLSALQAVLTLLLYFGFWRGLQDVRWKAGLSAGAGSAVALLPACLREGWTLAGDFSGQLLYDRTGQTYTAAYHSIESKTYTASSVFWGESTETRVFAAFSLPREGTGKRGCVSCTVQETGDAGGYFCCWAYYVHQKSWLQYPVMTAVEDGMASSWGETAFQTVPPWLAFTPRDGGTGTAEG